MRKNVMCLMMAVAVLCCTASCEDDKDDHRERWMIANTAAINALKSNPEYKELRSPGNEGSLYYKVLEAGTGTNPILYTSTVRCYYKGWYIADYPEYNITSGGVFEQQLFDDGPPISFTVNDADLSLIAGWKTALQHMVQGDKWEIWIPYQLGYGRNDFKASSSSRPIPGCSTLVFELEIRSVRGIDGY